MQKNFEFNTSETDNIAVFAYPELIGVDDNQRRLWGYVLRIENNSEEPIVLTDKNLYLVDETGNSFCDSSKGFHGELPDLQPGEYFEYEETTQTDGLSAVLYGFCFAVTSKGKKLKINLPVLNLDADQPLVLN